MKNDVLYMAVQPCTEKAFWITNIKHGIFSMSKDLQWIPCILNLAEVHNLPKLNNTPVLVVGNDDDWLDRALGLLTGLGARGIVVNGSMQDSEFHACSGVVFELEKAIRYILGQLQATGRKKTAFLGANPRSVSDLCKCKAFDSPENIIWAHGELESCVLDFIKCFREKGYDSVICANDTVAICLVRNLLEQGFSEYSIRSLVTRGECLGSVEIVGGESATVALLAAEDFSYALTEQEQVQIVISGPGFAYAPVVQGQAAGYAYIYLNDTVVGKVPLIYGLTVEQEKVQEPSFWQKLFGGNTE